MRGPFTVREGPDGPRFTRPTLQEPPTQHHKRSTPRASSRSQPIGSCLPRRSGRPYPGELEPSPTTFSSTEDARMNRLGSIVFLLLAGVASVATVTDDDKPPTSDRQGTRLRDADLLHPRGAAPRAQQAVQRAHLRPLQEARDGTHRLLDADRREGRQERQAHLHPRLSRAARPPPSPGRRSRADPVWKKAQAESEKDGKIVKKVESVYLNPTDYSEIK